MTFHERKARRAEWYFRFVYGWRTRVCSACAGSGYYDSDGSPRYSACDGTGKETYKGPKALQREKVG
jgi:DnaJ-class molecular chaperone